VSAEPTDRRRKIAHLVYFPGAMLLAMVVSSADLIPRAVGRSAEQQVAFWQRHVAEHPDFAASHLRLGHAFEVDGKPGLALASYETALELDPALITAAIRTSVVLRRRSGPGTSRDWMAAYLAEHPDCGPCMEELAADAFQLGELEDARAYVDGALLRMVSYPLEVEIGRPDDNARAYYLAGLIYQRLGYEDAAIEYFEAAISANRFYPGTYLALGAMLIPREPERALRTLQEYRRLGPVNPMDAVVLATAYMDAGEFAEAISVLERAKSDLLWSGDDATVSAQRRQVEGLLSTAKERMGSDGRSAL